MNGKRELGGDDRGVSTAVSSVLTMGITALLVASLLVGASSALDARNERGAEQALELVGERVASEVESVDRLASETPDSGTIELGVTHPRTVSGVTYSIELRADDCGPLIDSGTPCVALVASAVSAEAFVPLAVGDEPGLDSGSSVAGGSFTIGYNGDEISLERGGG